MILAGESRGAPELMSPFKPPGRAARGPRMTTIEFAYDRFCKERFPMPSEGQLFALQRQIGVPLPPDYRDFILEFNGGYFNDPIITPVGPGCPTECLDSLFGIGDSRSTVELGETASIGLFDDNNPPKIMPIGRTAVGGLIILDTAPATAMDQSS